MTMYHLKRIEGPVPATISDAVGWTCHIINRDDPTDFTAQHIDVANSAADKHCAILTQLNSLFPENDFNSAVECPA